MTTDQLEFPNGATPQEVVEFLGEQHDERKKALKPLSMFMDGGEIIEDNIVRQNLDGYGMVYIVYHEHHSYYELQFKFSDSSDNIDRMTSLWAAVKTQEDAISYMNEVRSEIAKRG